MPGYFTDKRVTGVPWFTKTVDRFDTAHPHIAQSVDPGVQQTTSFRSRLQTDDEIIADADKIFVNGFKSNLGGHNLHGSKNPYIDTGHSFRTTRQSVKLSHPFGYLANSDTDASVSSISGAIVPFDSFGGLTGTYPSVSPLTDSEIAYYGHVAIAQTNPIRPDANLSDFLVQSVLTKMPKLIGDLAYFRTKAGFLREAGDSYLNLEFGWAPFVSDLKGLMNTVLNSYKEITTYHKSSGKITRRHFKFSPITTVLSSGESVGGRIFSTTNLPEIFGNRTFGSIKQTITKSEDIYFKGAYTFYLPLEHQLNDGNLLDRLKRHADLAQHILGLKLTPQVIWDLAPWTWLADWQFDITSMLEIQSDFGTDSLVLLYGYLMRTTYVDNQYTISDLNPIVGDRGPYSITYSVVQKERVQATPYGFGVNPDTFSVRQLAILAALGITRLVKP
jgi:hypothetical protein